MLHCCAGVATDISGSFRLPKDGGSFRAAVGGGSFKDRQAAVKAGNALVRSGSIVDSTGGSLKGAWPAFALNLIG